MKTYKCTCIARGGANPEKELSETFDAYKLGQFHSDVAEQHLSSGRPLFNPQSVQPADIGEAEQCYKNMLNWFNDTQPENNPRRRHFVSVVEGGEL